MQLLRRLSRLALFCSCLGSVLLQAAPQITPNPHWETEIKNIETRDAARPARTDNILFVGSSSIRLWSSLETDFAGYPVYNHGFGGSHLIDSVAYANRIVIPLHPAKIFLYAGTNDIAGGVSPQDVFEHFKLFVLTVREKLPDTRIYYISIAPNPSRWKIRDKFQEANRLIEAYIKDGANLAYVDVYSKMLGADGQPLPDIYIGDGLHMNAKGYAIWADIIRPLLGSKTD